MGIGTRIGRPWKAVALVAVGAAGGGDALAVASRWLSLNFGKIQLQYHKHK